LQATPYQQGGASTGPRLRVRCRRRGRIARPVAAATGTAPCSTAAHVAGRAP